MPLELVADGLWVGNDLTFDLVLRVRRGVLDFPLDFRYLIGEIPPAIEQSHRRFYFPGLVFLAYLTVTFVRFAFRMAFFLFALVPFVREERAF